MNGLKGVLRNDLLRALGLSLTLISGVGYSGVAIAQTTQSEEASFDIPAQSLSKSLADFGMQSGVQVSAHADTVRGLKGNAVKGTMPAQQALQQLISGLGLYFEAQTDGSLLLSASSGKEGAITLDTIQVVAKAELDRHAGAADRVDSKYVSSEDLARRNPRSTKQIFAGEASISVGGGIPSIQKTYVRGVEEHNLAVTVDGARHTDKNFHHSGNNLIDPGMLKAVRVDPTVAPADAGPGALAGGISFETIDVADVLDPEKNVGGYITASYGTSSGTITNSNAGYGRVGGLEGIAFFKWANGDRYKAGDSGSEVTGTETNVESFLGKVGYETNDGHRVELSGKYIDDDAQRAFRANFSGFAGSPGTERAYKHKQYNYVFNYELTEPSGWFDPRVTLGYSKSGLRVPSPYGSVANTISISGKVENDFAISENNVVTAGFDFYNDQVNYRDPSTSEVEEEAWNLGAYAQARIEPLEKLRVSFGARLDTQRFTGIDGSDSHHTGASGNVFAAYDVVDWFTLKGGYSNVFGGVSLAESFIFNPAWDYTGGVDPVRAQNFTGGFGGQVNGFTYDFSIFRTDFDDARNASYGGGPNLVSDFRSEGYEAAVGYGWESGFVNLSYSDTQIEVDGEAADTYDSQYLGSPLGQVIALEAEQRFTNGIGIGGNIDAALDSSDAVTGPSSSYQEQEGYVVFNLFAEYQPPSFNNITVRFEANNVTDEKYADRGSYGSEYVTVDPLWEPGRSFLIYVKTTF